MTIEKTEKTDKPAPTAPFAVDAYEKMLGDLAVALKEKRGEVIASNPVLAAQGAELARFAQRQGLPAYSKLTEWAKESTTLSILTAAKDTAVVGAIGYGIVKGIKLGWAWYKGP